MSDPRGSIPQLLIMNSEMNLKTFQSWEGSIPPAFDPELRNECKKMFQSLGVHSKTFDPELRNKFKKFSNPGGVCPQIHIHHTDFISHTLLGDVKYPAHARLQKTENQSTLVIQNMGEQALHTCCVVYTMQSPYMDIS